MNIERQTLIILLCFILSFFYLRGFLYGLKRHQLNKTSYKKRKFGESLVEWFFYKRYRDIIPSFFYVFYLAVILLHLLGILSCWSLYLIHIETIGGVISIGIALFDTIWLLVFALLFRKNGPSFAYGRWIKNKSSTKHK